ncbi:MAG: EamA family transporter [Acidimicrobiales bacterium]|nr:EamA family transporter [Acidimicrobiales bacterium]MYH74155.1 EamA family transporter [Acidimicrobiales bacterium]MYK72299.1 EamA family transporter [Acidimicrobiales bacterium]
MSAPVERSWSASRVSPEMLFTVGAVSQYLGAATAFELFEELGPPTVALLRVAGAGAVLVLVRRSWRRRWSRAELVWTAAFGAALASMNLFFYLAIERVPLGNSVAIEFLGPIAVAALGTRTLRSGAALVLAIGGVVALAGFAPPEAQLGALFSLIAGALWAGYIILGHRVARAGMAVDGLGVGMLIGALVISPAGIADGGGGMSAAVGTPLLLAGGVAAGVLSNVIPYGIDQLVMQRLARARFALLQALLPVTATLIGLVWLHQVLSLREVAGIAAVIAAIVINRESDPTPGDVVG